MNLDFILHVLALGLFIGAAAGAKPSQLTAAGLACLVGTLLI
jgi:hypothetical protein